MKAPVSRPSWLATDPASPKGSITTKLHLLEDHTLEQLQRFGTGCGLLNEQGGELIHTEFNHGGSRIRQSCQWDERSPSASHDYCEKASSQHYPWSPEKHGPPAIGGLKWDTPEEKELQIKLIILSVSIYMYVGYSTLQSWRKLIKYFVKHCILNTLQVLQRKKKYTSLEGRFIHCSISLMQESLIAIFDVLYLMHIWYIHVPTHVVRMCVNASVGSTPQKVQYFKRVVHISICKVQPAIHVHDRWLWYTLYVASWLWGQTVNTQKKTCRPNQISL